MNDCQYSNSILVRLKQLHGDEETGTWKEVNESIMSEKYFQEEGGKKENNPPLDFQSLVKIQKCFETGSVLLDVEECGLEQIAIRVAEQMVIDGLIEKAATSNLLNVLLLSPERDLEYLGSKEQISGELNSTGSQIIDMRALRNHEDINFNSTELESNNVLTETAIVMTGSVSFLQKPAIAFVRLMTAAYFPDVRIHAFPVRFILIILGPKVEGLNYFEISRCIYSILRDDDFSRESYKFKLKKDLLAAVEHFFAKMQVIPLASSTNCVRRRKSEESHPQLHEFVRSKDLVEDEQNELLTNKKCDRKNSGNPLERTNRLWGGLINDMKRRLPHYKSDIIDGLNRETIAASLFLYFGVLSTTITFGGLLSDKTNNLIGISETLLSTSIVGIVFHLLSSQPLIIVGGTGPLLLFDEALFQLCKSYHFDFLTVRIYIGLWLGLIAVMIAAFDGCACLKLLTRFTQELFASLIALIFMMEAVFKVIDVFKSHPMLAEYNLSSTQFNISQRDNMTNKIQSNHDIINQPNTALFCTILSIGTFFFAYCLRVLRNSHFLGRYIRRTIGDFGVPISIATFVFFSYLAPQVYTDKLIVPEGASPTDPNQRSWLIPFNALDIWVPFASCVAAMLAYILIFMETQISELILSKPERKLTKGSGFHVDIVIICLLNILCGFLGMPWQSGATIRSITHVSAVTVISQSTVIGDKSQVLHVKEQRVSGLIISTMIGVSVTITSLLRQIPMSVLYGVFFYMGLSSISGAQFLHRIQLLFTPVKYHGSQIYVKRVRTWKMHVFTVIQIAALCILWTVKSSKFSLALPFVLVLMVPLRKLLSSYFTAIEMVALDGKQSEIDADGEPDFYDQPHNVPTEK